jgi:hypothetical protein
LGTFAAALGAGDGGVLASARPAAAGQLAA